MGRAHSKSLEIQMIACRALQHLSTSPEGAAQVAEAGGCKACVDIMSARPEDALVQQLACHALELIAFGGSEPRLRAISDGAAEVPVQVLKLHRASPLAQQAALAALQAILEEGGASQQIVADAGGLQAAVNTVSDHKGDANIQYWGRLLIQSLCIGNNDLRAEASRKLHYK